MSRLIDADALKANCDIMVGGTTIGRREYVMFHEIDSAPTIDAVEVVRCKECTYRGLCFGRILIGDKLFTVDYCSYGKKETDHE